MENLDYVQIGKKIKIKRKEKEKQKNYGIYKR